MNASGVYYNSTDNDGMTALMHTSWFGSLEMAKSFLAQEEVDPNLKNNAGQTALFWAARYGNLGVVELLLKVILIDPNEPLVQEVKSDLMRSKREASKVLTLLFSLLITLTFIRHFGIWCFMNQI